MESRLCLFPRAGGLELRGRQGDGVHAGQQGLGIHYREGAVGGGGEWMGVVSDNKLVYNIIV